MVEILKRYEKNRIFTYMHVNIWVPKPIHVYPLKFNFTQLNECVNVCFVIQMQQIRYDKPVNMESTP